MLVYISMKESDIYYIYTSLFIIRDHVYITYTSIYNIIYTCIYNIIYTRIYKHGGRCGI